MRKVIVPACLLLLAATLVSISGFKKENETDILYARIAELEKQLAAATEIQTDSTCSFNYFYGDKKMADFLKQNLGKPGINAITMQADSLRKMFNNVAANYTGPVTVAMVHSIRGVELNIVNTAEGLLCGPGICCPPRCRQEWLGILNIPTQLTGLNTQQLYDKQAITAAE